MASQSGNLFDDNNPFAVWIYELFIIDVFLNRAIYFIDSTYLDTYKLIYSLFKN